jgi:hypothetical protein
MSPDDGNFADLIVAKGGRFVVCFCGRVLHMPACSLCGYEIPEVRERRTNALLEQWRADARRAIAHRARMARLRAARRAVRVR